MSSDEDVLAVSTDPLHVRPLHGMRTDSVNEVVSVHSPRISFQSCVQGFIGSGGLLEPEVAHLYPRWVGLLRFHSGIPCVVDLRYYARDKVYIAPSGVQKERIEPSYVHVRPAVPTSHPHPTHRPRLSPSSENKPQRVGVCTLVSERIR